LYFTISVSYLKVFFFLFQLLCAVILKFSICFCIVEVVKLCIIFSLHYE